METSDVREQTRWQTDLVEAERRLSLATEAAQIGIWDWNIESGEFFYSDRARQIYGFSSNDTITYELLRNRTHPDDYGRIEPLLARSLDPHLRAHETYRYRITRADTGEERWLLAHGGAVFSSDAPDAKALRFTGTLQDITAEVQMEEHLRDQQARLELALTAGDLALWELDLASGKVTHSPALNRLYGFSEGDIPSYDDFAKCYAPGENERLQNEATAAMARGETSIRVEAKHIMPDGTLRWVGVRAQIFVSETGVPTRVIGIAMDVTERRQWEETLVVTAAELQHRVKNTLAVVQSLASQTFRSESSAKQAVDMFHGRLRALASATDLVTRDNWIAVPLHDLVEEVIAPFQDEKRFVIGGDTADVDSRDAANLSIVLHELCTNAVKYGALSNDRGHVEIKWKGEGDLAVLEWCEQNGPPVRTPTRAGFGSKLLRSDTFAGTGGAIQLQFDPAGLRATLSTRRRMIHGG